MLTVHTLESADALRIMAPVWNDLWQRSAVTLPSSRAEHIAHWLETFAPDAQFKALVVEQDCRLVAALPLVEGRVGRLFKVGTLPGNDWFPSADLLADPLAEEGVYDALVAAIEQVGWSMLSFEAVNLESSRWQAFVEALERTQSPWASRERFAIGITDVGRDWTDYQEGWSSNHRRHMRKSEARALRAGELKLTIFDRPNEDEIESLLRRGFEIEDACWKGMRGSSVLKSPQIFEFYLEQARELARADQLSLVFLESAGRTIAFEYGWNSKAVYHSLKVGYDETASELSPGQLLRLKLLERFYAEGQQRWVDFLGPITPATEKWSTRSYLMSRLIVATHRPLIRLLLDAYSWSRGLRRHVSLPAPPAVPQPVGVAVPMAVHSE